MFLKKGGHSEDYRIRVNKAKISKYLQLLKDHNNGKHMYRSKETLIRNKKPKDSKCFLTKGYDFAVLAPVTKNKALGSEIKKNLEEISQKNSC